MYAEICSLLIALRTIKGLLQLLNGTCYAHFLIYILFWGSTGISLHDLQFNKLLIYLIRTLYAAPQFSHCLKQVVLAPVSLRPPSR